MKKIRTKFWYIQDWGTYSNQTAVFVGFTPTEITKVMKKAGLSKEAIAEWENGAGAATKMFTAEAENSGGMWFSNKGGYSLLWMPIFEDSWKCYDTLVHECCHAVLNILGGQKNMIRSLNHELFIEDEALAYQQEFLFRKIRNKLREAFKERKPVGTTKKKKR